MVVGSVAMEQCTQQRLNYPLFTVNVAEVVRKPVPVLILTHDPTSHYLFRDHDNENPFDGI